MSTAQASSIPVRRSLLLVAAVAVLPVAVAAGFSLRALIGQQYEAASAKSLEVARMAAAAIETEAQRSSATLRAIAASPWIDRDDVEQFHVLMVRTLGEMPAWASLSLAAPDGRVVIHTAGTPGAPPPAIGEIESFRSVVQRQTPTVGHLRRGDDGAWGVPVRVPVRRNGELRYVLSAVLKPDAFVEIIRSQGLPDDWVMSVFDRRGARIARSVAHEANIGGAPAPSLKALIDRGGTEGTGITHSLEGQEVFTAFVRGPFSGWTVAIGLPTGTIAAAARRALAFYGGGALVSLLLAVVLATFAGWRIAGPIAALRASAERLGRGEVPQIPSTRIEELRALGRAIAGAAATREGLEQERRTMLEALVVTRDGLARQVHDLERLHALSNDLLKLDTLDAQLDNVLGAFCELQQAPQGLLSLVVPGGTALQLHAARGFSEEARTRLRRVEAGAGACGLALRHGSSVAIVDTESDARFEPLRDLARAEGFRSVHSTPIRGSDGRVLGVLSVHRPVPHAPDERETRLAELMAHLCSIFTERAAARAEADRSSRRLAVALDSSTVPFAILAPLRDATGTVVDFVAEHLNEAAAHALRRPRDELTGQPLAAAAPQLWRLPGLFDACLSVVASGHPRDLEIRTTVDEEDYWLQVVATPFEGKVALWGANITERKRQERTLQAADRRKDEFLAILAHELRNPLAPIQQAAMIASAPGATEAQLRWSQEVIVRQVKHMSLLLDDLLDVSRITRGKLELRKTRIELAEVVQVAAETARPHLEAKGHRLVISLPPAPIPLLADPMRVAQILTNLLTNAARYTPAGGTIAVHAALEERSVAITVTDSGIGIAPDQLESIFEMFSRGSAGAAHGGGLGIGLALSRGVAQLHGGSLTAASAGAGHGSSFTLRLPFDGSAAPAAAAPSVMPIAGAPLRILVADDNRDAADTLASLLRLNGHDVRAVYEGAAALAMQAEYPADVVILDIGMPGMSGYEVAQRIRASPESARPTLVALTGWGQAKDRATASSAGFDHHLTKPVDVRALFAILRAQPARSARLLRA